MNTIEQEELRALAQRIISSGELGRSRTYADILNYLVECSIEGQNPKEMAIAVDVLDREADFDVGKDSIVRVHIYHLRSKLKNYYKKQGSKEKFRLDIPKGQYMITVEPNEGAEVAADGGDQNKAQSRKSWPLTPALFALACLLLFLNLFFLAQERADIPAVVADPEESVFAGLGPWQHIFASERPVLILIGDYYIFGELNEQGDVARMVREFDVNSAAELEFMQGLGINGSGNYMNLDLSYIPTSSASALASVMSVLMQGVSPERIQVKMSSEFTTSDLANNHLIYLGYLSGLGNLRNLMFSASGLTIGDTYDELYHYEAGRYYNSTSGLSAGRSGYRDYGMLTTFPSPTGHQVVMIAGMRDQSLISVAELASNAAALQALESSVGQRGSDSAAYEALYEVTGFNNTNFSSELIYSEALDPQAVRTLFGN